MCGLFMDANFHGGSNDTIGGRGRLRRPEISPIYPFQLFPILGSFHISMASVLLTPEINLSPVSLLPAKKLFSGVNDTGNKFIAGVLDTGDKFIPGINDTGDH
jgi:hypothetical protein